MDKAQALYAFWNSFGVKAIDEQSSYDEDTLDDMEIDFPYITYETATSNFDNEVALSANLWDKSVSWARITQLSDAISAYIGYGGRVIEIDGGYLWIKLGTPFAQRMPVDNSDSVRRIYLSIMAEYMTAT